MGAKIHFFILFMLHFPLAASFSVPPGESYSLKDLGVPKLRFGSGDYPACARVPLALVIHIPSVHTFMYHRNSIPYARSRMAAAVCDSDDKDGGGVAFESLMDMDIVVFSRRPKAGGGKVLTYGQDETDAKLELGAMQEDGTIAPLSAWTLDSAFAGGSSDSIEFLVDEEDRFPGLTANDVVVHSVLDESLIGYGSRQVGGGKGPGNPHGEESELLYYVERSVLEGSCGDCAVDGREINVVIKPELEILW